MLLMIAAALDHFLIPNVLVIEHDDGGLVDFGHQLGKFVGVLILQQLVVALLLRRLLLLLGQLRRRPASVGNAGKALPYVLTHFVLVDAEHERVEDCGDVVPLHLVASMRPFLSVSK